MLIDSIPAKQEINRELCVQQIMSLRLPWTRNPIKINDITSSMKKCMGVQESEARCKLATAYRLTHFSGWDELIYGHLTLRVPGTQHILINPFGMHYNEITASSLVKIDLAGNIIDKGTSDFSFQRTGYVIHSAIHENRPDLNALMHIHSRAGVGVACSVDALVPMCQHSVFIEPVSYHPFRGIVTEESEKVELAENFVAPSKCLLMKNHGLLTGGATIEEAFIRMYMFQTVCQAYVDAGYTHRPVPSETILSGDVIKQSVEAAASQDGKHFGMLDFRALARQLDSAGYETGYPHP
ncbi:hypothetical protein ACHWQZ_G017626 [Mnemiopsis leidyi]